MAQTQLEESPSTRPDRGGLDISIRTGSGAGRTLLSAFDHALQQAGVANFNLVTLSSVIPPGSRIRNVSGTLPGGHGDLLFCVRAEAFAEHPGEIAWAGLGWCVDDNGGGLFVEHSGGSERSVVEQIELSLADMNANRGGGYGPPQIALASAHSTGFPVCAVVVATYRVSTWHEDAAEPRREEPAAVAVGHRERPNGNAPRKAHQYPRPNGAPVANEVAVAEASATDEVVPAVPQVKVTVEKEVDYVTARRYYELYRETFGEMETSAVARQILHEQEFLEEMLDPRVHKYVAWDDDGQAIGMTTLTSELETVPWISPEYFAQHYPEQHARNAIFYLGFTLVHPAHQGGHVFHAMVAAMWERFTRENAVVAWDMCLLNDERGLGGSAGRLLRSLAEVTIEPIDRQTYYAATFNGPRETAEAE